MTEPPLVHLERHDGGVALLSLDDPRRANAFTLEMCAQIGAAVDEVEADPSLCSLVVTGAGKYFCAGADLSSLGASRNEGLRAIYDGFLRIARCSLPTVAAVGGAAVGAGMNLALATDVRVASVNARFDTRFLALGIHPGGGHSWMLRRAVGHAEAAAMMLFGEVVDGPEAQRRGLAQRCVGADALIPTAVELAAGASQAPRELLMRATATLRSVETCADHDEAVERELITQLWSMDQPDFAERLAALSRSVRADP
ncbi:MAG: enoyl-CoA hydratase [Microthrixaceae bacterium]